MAFSVSDLDRRTAIIAEMELGEVSVQMGSIAMLVNTDPAALEDWEAISKKRN